MEIEYDRLGVIEIEPVRLGVMDKLLVTLMVRLMDFVMETDLVGDGEVGGM